MRSQIQAIAERHIRRISAMEPQHRAFGVMGDKHARDVKATAQTTIDAEFWGAYLIVIAAAAIVTMTHPKPGLIPLLLWYAGHPL
jgi:hypothetical protein